MKLLTDEQKSRIHELLDSGMSLAAISADVGCAVGTVRAHRDKRNHSTDDENEDAEVDEVTTYSFDQDTLEDIARACAYAASISPDEHGKAAVAVLSALQEDDQ